MSSTASSALTRTRFTRCGTSTRREAASGQSSITANCCSNCWIPARSSREGCSGYRVTYHDPCTLGRYNGVYDPPREVLRRIGCDLVEMPRSRDNSFCCGAGGGRIWMKELSAGGTPRPSEQRIHEAAAIPALERFVVCLSQGRDDVRGRHQDGGPVGVRASRAKRTGAGITRSPGRSAAPGNRGGDTRWVRRRTAGEPCR